MYVIHHGNGSQMQCLAKRRMDHLWAGWLECASQSPELGDTNYPQCVGMLMDAHVALALSVNQTLTMADVFRLQLAPEQTNSNVGAPKEIVAVVAAAWKQEQKKMCAISKLLSKGMPSPRSVRYIRPQLQRCGECSKSVGTTSAILRAWVLGQYDHRRTVAGPKRRLEVHAMDFSELLTMLDTQSSRGLYYIVAECIAAITLSVPSIHIRAAGTTHGFADYAEHVLCAASSLAIGKIARARARQTPSRAGQRPARMARTVSHIQLDPSVSRAQAVACHTKLGLTNRTVFACTVCCTIHVKTPKPSRAAKSRIGVSIDLCNPHTAVCNKCAAPSTAVNLVGVAVSGLVNSQHGIVTTCTMCATCAINPRQRGADLMCQPCFNAALRTDETSAGVCPCGSQTVRGRGGQLFMAQSASGAKLFMACQAHAHIVHGAPVVRVEVWKQLFAVLRKNEQAV